VRRTGILLGATVVGAALLRLATLDSQSFGDFETYTVVLQRMSFGSMVSEIPEFEGTPPLYYIVSWFWSQLFGTGEVGLRTLPAILSIATVPVTYAIGRTLVNARVGLIAAALMAVNPLAVWYAQEARAYALLMFLTALGLLFFVRLLRDTGSRTWNLVGWSAASAAALLTHYFAALVIVPEAIWLYVAASARRPVLAAMMPPAITGAALIPLIVEQSEQAGGGEPEATALATRVAQFPKQFLVGYDVPLEVPLAIAGGALVLLSLWLLIRRANQDARRGAQVAGVIAASGTVILLLLAVVGADYFLTRYLTVLLVPLSVVLAAGFAAVPRGLLGAGALAVVFLAAVIAVQTDATAQRPDLRGALEPLGDPPPGGRVVYITSITRIDVYLPGARFTDPEGEEVQEAVVVGLSVVGADTREDPSIDVRPPSEFKLVESTETDSYERLRFRAAAPARASPLELLNRPPGSVPVAFYYQPG
jgi:hypothetical protein